MTDSRHTPLLRSSAPVLAVRALFVPTLLLTLLLAIPLAGCVPAGPLPSPSATPLSSPSSTAPPVSPTTVPPTSSPTPPSSPTPSLFFARVPEMTVKSATPGYTGPALTSRLVDVREFAPGICIDLIYATTDNFMGEKLYERDLCLMQADTLEKLLKAQDIFQRDGYSIKIYDAYRPYAVTVKMAAFPGGDLFVADPKKGSNHNRGAAVDMTVVDARGHELEMSSVVDTLDATAYRNSPMSAAARRDLDYVEGVMRSCGFVPNRYEWWHYNDSQYARYPILDLALGDIAMAPAESVPRISPPPVVDPAKSGYVSVSPTPLPMPTPTP